MEELRLQEELRKTRQELLLLYEIGNLIRTTMLLDEVIYFPSFNEDTEALCELLHEVIQRICA